jgi:hypothetical protein
MNSTSTDEVRQPLHRAVTGITGIRTAGPWTRPAEQLVAGLERAVPPDRVTAGPVQRGPRRIAACCVRRTGGAAVPGPGPTGLRRRGRRSRLLVDAHPPLRRPEQEQHSLGAHPRALYRSQSSTRAGSARPSGRAPHSAAVTEPRSGCGSSYRTSGRTPWRPRHPTLGTPARAWQQSQQDSPSATLASQPSSGPGPVWASDMCPSSPSA